MSKLKDAIKVWEKSHGVKASEEEVIKLCGRDPPIQKMDSQTLNLLRNCRILSLSSNNIEKIGNLSALQNLEILSLGRNNIRKIENMDGVGNTLKQLWISYNRIDKLTGIEKLKKLQVLYMSNNLVDKWSEFDKLKELPELQDLSFHGNKLHDIFDGDEDKWRLAVLKRLPKLKVLDGITVFEQELEKAKKFG